MCLRKDKDDFWRLVLKYQIHCWSCIILCLLHINADKKEASKIYEKKLATQGSVSKLGSEYC